jgi:hypothetical protein
MQLMDNLCPMCRRYSILPGRSTRGNSKDSTGKALAFFSMLRVISILVSGFMIFIKDRVFLFVKMGKDMKDICIREDVMVRAFVIILMVEYIKEIGSKTFLMDMVLSKGNLHTKVIGKKVYGMERELLSHRDLLLRENSRMENLMAKESLEIT